MNILFLWAISFITSRKDENVFQAVYKKMSQPGKLHWYSFIISFFIGAVICIQMKVNIQSPGCHVGFLDTLHVRLCF